MANNIKTTVNIPEWAEYFTSAGAVTSNSQAYQTVPLIYRCVKLVSDSLSSAPLKCYTGQGENRKEVDWPWPELDPTEWTRKTTASLLIWGASYSVILGNPMRRGLGLQWVNPSTVTPQSSAVDEYGRPVISYQQSAMTSGGRSRTWGPEEMLYIREWNPVDDVAPGPSPVKVALTDAGLIRYLTRFASYYFENGAMPLTILSIDRATPEAEVQRVQSVFKSLYTGINKAWKLIALRGGKDSAPFTLTPPLKDLVMPELHEQSRRAVAAAFGIPQTMLEDAANYATAAEHTMQFWTTTIRPRGYQITAALNEQVGKKLGITFEYAFEELDIFQEDEAQRATSLGQLTRAGVPLLIAMDILGYDLDADDRAQLEAQIKQKEKDKEEEQNENSSQPDQNVIFAPVEAPGEAQPDEMTKDMGRWRKKAQKALERGENANVEFTSEFIPAAAAASVRAKLADCKTAEDVRAAFEVERPKEPGLPELLAELKRANDLLEKEAKNG